MGDALGVGRSAGSEILEDLAAKLDGRDRDVALLVASHGAVDWLGCLREIVSNAVDASVGVSETDPPPIRIESTDGYLTVRDEGMGFQGEIAELLLNAAVTTKSADSGTIGRMGIGFLASLGALDWAVVRTAGSGRPQGLSLGAVPEDVASRLEFPRQGTLVGLAFRSDCGRRPMPSAAELARHLSRHLPAVAPPLDVRDRKGDSVRVDGNAGIWRDDRAGSWREALVRLGIADDAWSTRHAETRVILVALRHPAPGGGRATVLQHGVLLQEDLDLPVGPDGASLVPPWLVCVTERDDLAPLLTRNGLATGSTRDRLYRDVEAAVRRTLEDGPCAGLVALVPELQRNHGATWTRWAKRQLRADHPLRLATVWETTDRGTIALGEVVKRRIPTRIAVGRNASSDLLWADMCSLPGQRTRYVRVADDDEADLLKDTLADAGCPVEVVAFEAVAREEAPAAPSEVFRRFARGLAGSLGPKGVDVETLRFRSRSLLGVLHQANETRKLSRRPALHAATDLAPLEGSRSRTLVLNESSNILYDAALQFAEREPTHAEAIAILASVAAQERLGDQLIAPCGQALGELLSARFAARGGSRPNLPDGHARVFLIAPFAESALLCALREILEAPPYYAEVVRADDYWRTPSLWANVEEKIRDACAYVCDIRGKNPNVMIELGYVLSFARERPRCVIGSSADITADLAGMLHIEGPLDDTNRSVDDVRAMLQKSGLVPSALVATAPFQAARVMPTATRQACRDRLPDDVEAFLRNPRPDDDPALAEAWQRLTDRERAFRAERLPHLA